jgi:hypothetical protein
MPIVRLYMCNVAVVLMTSAVSCVSRPARRPPSEPRLGKCADVSPVILPVPSLRWQLLDREIETRRLWREVCDEAVRRSDARLQPDTWSAPVSRLTADFPPGIPSHTV